MKPLALSKTLAAGVFEGEHEDWDVDVEFGLDRILDGIDVLIESRPAPELDGYPPPNSAVRENRQESS